MDLGEFEEKKFLRVIQYNIGYIKREAIRGGMKSCKWKVHQVTENKNLKLKFIIGQNEGKCNSWMSEQHICRERNKKRLYLKPPREAKCQRLWRVRKTV